MNAKRMTLMTMKSKKQMLITQRLKYFGGFLLSCAFQILVVFIDHSTADVIDPARTGKIGKCISNNIIYITCKKIKRV